MSLLMDALKKAEREKNKAASKKSTEESSGSTTSDQINSVQVENTVPDLDSTEHMLSEDKGENWAFDTGELELEPLQQKAESEPDQAVHSQSDNVQPDNDAKSSTLENDDTVEEPMPAGAFSPDDDLTLKSETGSGADFDHDATLPSERAIQSSLKDYFEASQSITMDQNSVSAAVAPDVTEHSISSTSPLDVSSTHVTAHTIFAANQARKASTGLARYALYGTLLLGAGLGAVALYYSYVTPTMIDMPETLPTVATILESDEKSRVVDVTTIEVEAPFEPGTSLKVDLEDPVLAEVVEEIATNKPDQSDGNTPGLAVAEKNDPVDQEQTSTQMPVTNESVVAETAPMENVAITRPVIPQKKVEHVVTDFTKFDNVAKVATGETIIVDGQLYKNDVLQGGYTLEDGIIVNEQSISSVERSIDSTGPIEVMAAEDFSESLTMPRSAIKITKGRSRQAGNSDLAIAYQAYQAGDFLTAKAAYRKVLNRRSDSRDARLGIAAIAVMEGNYDSAYQHYQYLLQQNPKDQVVNAALFNLQGNAAGGVNESQLKLLLDQNPDSPQVHFSLGSFYAGQSRWPEAQQAFFDAYSADKNNADYAYNLAVSLDQLGQSKSAADYYRTALKLSDRTQVSFNSSRVLARIQKLSGIVKK